MMRVKVVRLIVVFKTGYSSHSTMSPSSIVSCFRNPSCLSISVFSFRRSPTSSRCGLLEISHGPGEDHSHGIVFSVAEDLFALHGHIIPYDGIVVTVPFYQGKLSPSENQITKLNSWLVRHLVRST